MDNDNKGNKHICRNCSTKFYDLNKKEVICPKCGTRQEEYNNEKTSNEEITKVNKKKDIQVDNILKKELDEDINFDADEDKDDNVIEIE